MDPSKVFWPSTSSDERDSSESENDVPEDVAMKTLSGERGDV